MAILATLDRMAAREAPARKLSLDPDLRDRIARVVALFPAAGHGEGEWVRIHLIRRHTGWSWLQISDHTGRTTGCVRGAIARGRRLVERALRDGRLDPSDL
jgi:hypothetical protein